MLLDDGTPLLSARKQRARVAGTEYVVSVRAARRRRQGWQQQQQGLWLGLRVLFC
jgi:hypothetical protein